MESFIRHGADENSAAMQNSFRKKSIIFRKKNEKILAVFALVLIFRNVYCKALFQDSGFYCGNAPGFCVRDSNRCDCKTFKTKNNVIFFLKTTYLQDNKMKSNRKN